MKAKDLAARFKASPTNETLVTLALEVHKEAGVLFKLRKTESNDAYLAVIREQDDKWRAFSRLCPAVNPDGFRLTLHKLAPLLVPRLWPNWKPT
jgi:hypothetical protein